ncbi:MAG: DUF86 domain-containing protein [Amaricoccus sp.]|uniref:HepT-like ribonuclease domain-containing protein n=1 Tax=Amaricoccus sp. TaxID=1872485 RepID=UPI0039E3A173
MTQRSSRIGDWLTHIIDAVMRIDRYTAALAFEGFVASELIQDAVIRNLEIIGEAAGNIERADREFAMRHPDLPLRSAKEMRNVLTHAYFAIISLSSGARSGRISPW